jgi:hypothetical protein
MGAVPLFAFILDLLRTCKLDLTLKISGVDIHAAAEGGAPVLAVLVIVIVAIWVLRPRRAP